MWIARCLALLLACQPAPVVGPETEPITAQEIPAFPPDSFPSAIYNDSSYIVEDPACSRIPFMRSIVSVAFVEGTTHEERQAAVDHVNGTVVGGVPLSDQGVYLIRVEDDATGAGVCAAEAALDELPTVDRAGPDQIAEDFYRQPRDGANWQNRQRDPDLSDRDNQAPAVPPVASDTVPEGFYDEDNFRMGSACITGRMLRGIVVVMFEGGTTQPQKQEAIDLIDGDVVGGIRSRDDIEGYYYVQVEEDPEGRILCNAVETLNALPRIANATESLTVSAFHRRPDDGGV